MWMRAFVGWLLLLFPLHVFASVGLLNALSSIRVDYTTILTLAIGAFIGIGLSALFIFVSIKILRWLKRAA